MEVDDSFTKPGAVPFKWEIRPGVPKLQPPPPSPLSTCNLDCSSPIKLKPPPSGFHFEPPLELHSRLYQSSRSRSCLRSRSESCRLDKPIRAGPEIVSAGCFPAPLLGRKHDKTIDRKIKSKPVLEPDYSSDNGWSVSYRKSLSPFRNSQSSSSSYQSLPRLPSDAEWAGFGLF